MIKNYVISIYNKTYIIRRYKSFKINDLQYLFLGKITENDYKPIINCLYIDTNNRLIMRSVSKNKNIIQFTIPGVPKAKGRPRFRTFGKFVSTYTDSKTVKAENNIRSIFERLKNLPKIANYTPVNIDIEFQMAIPSSISKKKRLELNNQFHIKKPDIDNLCKSVLDGLNEVAYTDDSLISKLSCEKFYSNEPKTVVNISY